MIDAILKKLRRAFSTVLDYLKWEFHEGLSIKFLQCMFCDVTNFFSSLFILFINISIILLIVSAIGFIINIFLPLPGFFPFFPVFGVVLIPLSIFFGFLTIPVQCYLLYLSYQKSATKPHYLSKGCHTGIIFCHYNSIVREAFIGDAIALLVDNLLCIKEPYKVYHCKSKNNFISVYTNENVDRLWIIGHGQKNAFNAGEDTIEYSQLPFARPKKFIAQLHCNHGEGPTLITVNKALDGFYSDYDRMTFQNRCYIMGYFNNRSFKERLLLHFDLTKKFIFVPEVMAVTFLTGIFVGLIFGVSISFFSQVKYLPLILGFILVTVYILLIKYLETIH